MGTIHSGAKQKAAKDCLDDSKKRSGSSADLEVGRIAVTWPRYGRLDLYVKRDEKRGAVFVCMEDGGRFGTTAGVRKRFSDVGSYNGWGYVNPGQTVVFRFVPGDGSDAPESIIAIETSEGLVDFPASARREASYSDGALVAFYARPVRWSPSSQPRREATDVFPVDAEHLPVVARLISVGRLSFPEHNDVLELFFDAIPGLQETDRRNRSLYESALAFLAADSSIPAQFQTLARVERSKLSSVESSATAAAQTQRQTSRHIEVQGAKKEKRKAARSNKGRILADVMHVDLRIDRD